MVMRIFEKNLCDILFKECPKNTNKTHDYITAHPGTFPNHPLQPSAVDS